MLKKYFLKLGFSENEVRVYLILIELGKATANLLSKKAGIPRTTAYSVLDSLKEKGLIAQEQSRGTTLYVANKPPALLRMIAQEQAALTEKKQLTKELVEAIAPYFKKSRYTIPKLQFFEGKKSVDTMLFDYLPEWEQSILADDRIWWGYQDHSFVKEYMPWLEHHWVRNKKKSIRVKLFSNRSKVEEKLQGQILNREVRSFPLEFQFKSSIWICGDYVILLVTNEKPHYAFQMHNAMFAESLKAIFQLLWSLKLAR